LADKILLEVVTPVERVLSKEVDEVVAPGELGEFGVLPGHVPFLTLLLPGELRYRIGGDERRPRGCKRRGGPSGSRSSFRKTPGFRGKQEGT